MFPFKSLINSNCLYRKLAASLYIERALKFTAVYFNGRELFILRADSSVKHRRILISKKFSLTFHRALQPQKS
jgi:hypothetical protein